MTVLRLMYSRSDRDGYHEQRVTATDDSIPLQHYAEGCVGRIKVWCYQLAYMYNVFINKKCSLCEGSWNEVCT